VQGIQGLREAGRQQRQGGAPGPSGRQVCVIAQHKLRLTATHHQHAQSDSE
jgi:hypothetical protein